MIAPKICCCFKVLRNLTKECSFKMLSAVRSAQFDSGLFYQLCLLCLNELMIFLLPYSKAYCVLIPEAGRAVHEGDSADILTSLY
jgi:hypothetical protein